MSNPNHDAHRTAVAVAESARQISKAANNTAAGHKAADIVFYKAVLASGRTNGIQTNAIAALAMLGVDTADYRAGDV
jgi:hypothetical protein